MEIDRSKRYTRQEADALAKQGWNFCEFYEPGVMEPYFVITTKAAADRYALFAFTPYEAAGGVDDLVCTGTLQECIDRVMSKDGEYVQIARMDTLQVVASGAWRYRMSPLVGQPGTYNFVWGQCPCCIETANP